MVITLFNSVHRLITRLYNNLIFKSVGSHISNPQTTYTNLMNIADMDKLKITGRDLGRVFNSSLGHACICRAIVCITKQPNLKMKIWPKLLLGSFPLAFALPIVKYLRLQGAAYKLAENRVDMDASFQFVHFRKIVFDNNFMM
jgi:hypothetical protein